MAQRTFHVGASSWNPSAGRHFKRFLSPDAAIEQLPGGKKALVASTLPMRVDNGSGMAPTSLALHSEVSGFAPSNPIVPMTISKKASGGVRFAAGLSVQPTSVASSEAPVVTGDTVVFANAARDTDVMMAPRPAGGEISWQLRSAESPAAESLKFAFPGGARVIHSRSVPGAVEVLVGGEPQLLIPPASATSADGTSLSTSYALDGNVLTTRVDLGGSVDFPVLVDPTLLWVGKYGSFGNGAWPISPIWQHSESYPTFGATALTNLLQEFTPAGGGAPVNAFGELYAYAPGSSGKAGSAGITRVDLVGVGHNHVGQSDLYAEIGGTNGEHPIWTFNGTLGKQGYSPLVAETYFEKVPIAFCAQEGGAGGHDGGSVPLCEEENHWGSYFVLADVITGSQANANYVNMEGAQLTFRDPAAPNRVVLNTSGYNGHWLKEAPSTFWIEAEDEGLGIAEFKLFNGVGSQIASESAGCKTEVNFVGCGSFASSASLNLTAAGLTGTGQYTLEPSAVDAAGNGSTPSGSYVVVNMDKTAPAAPTLSGSLYSAANTIIGNGSYTLGMSSTDGSTSEPQSGVRRFEVKVDGKAASTIETACAEPHGVPSEACFGLTGSWTMKGQTYGAGVHTVSVTATDWTGNQSTSSFVVTINEAASVPIGPGTVNLETGDFRIAPSDVSLPGGTATLSVSRSYDSQATDSSSPLGPQWSLSLTDGRATGEWQRLVKNSTSSVVLRTVHGALVTFVSNGSGGFTSPPGYQNYTLTEVGSEYQLADAEGDYVRFAFASNDTYYPKTSVQATAAGGLNKLTYSFETVGTTTRPTQVLMPEPSSGLCSSSLVRGCRALTFTYSTSKTATGEAESEWGQYEGRLQKVSLVAWDPAKAEMTTTPVAEYTYDKTGRLRAEWDPRVSPALKTKYGYDTASELTSITPPGEQPWILTYGTIPSDSSAGRLISTSRLSPSTALWNGAALTNTTAPSLSTSSPTVSEALSTGNGSWSSEAVAYGYRWERCLPTETLVCTPIAGATNKSYTPLVADVGYKLRAQVTATGSAGSVTVATAVSQLVVNHQTYLGAFGSSGEGSEQMNHPAGVAVAPNGNVWVSDSQNHRIDEFTSTGSWVAAIGWGVTNGESKLEKCTTGCKIGLSGSGNGQLSTPTGIAVNATSNPTVFVADTAQNRVVRFETNGQFFQNYGVGKLSAPHGVAIGHYNSLEYLWVADTGNCNGQRYAIGGQLEETFGFCGTGSGAFGKPVGIVPPGGFADMTDEELNRVEHQVNHTLWSEFGSAGSEPGKFNGAYAMAVLANGNLAISSFSDGRVEIFSPEGTFIEQFGSAGSGAQNISHPAGVAGNATGSTIYVADEGNNRIDEWGPSTLNEEPTQAPPSPGTTSVTTIEYRVPVSGTGLPKLTEGEVAKWGQSDKPTEATAIFPADEPQGWPASDYKRASLYYLDTENHTVNTAAPSGGVTTTEYNAANGNVERTLSADNREQALKEGAGSAEASKLLDTQYTYSTDGTELTGLLGPQHSVKLANGSVVSARRHTSYTYDEGAPGTGGPYRLVTKTTEGAQIVGQEEKDVRTVKNFYSGQENLGWKLHKPTSTETNTGTQALTSHTAYDPSTGLVTETQAPANGGSSTPTIKEDVTLPSGTAPGDITAGSDGNLWVTGLGSNKVARITPSATVTEFEVGASGLFVTGPSGIASGPDGNLWFIEGLANHVDKMTTSGTLTKYVGSRKETWDVDVATGPDGNLWVTLGKSNYIAKVNTSGEFLSEYALPSGSEPKNIVAGPDGNLWFTNWLTSKIGKITTSGTITEYALPSGSHPFGIASGPDGNLWFTEYGTEKIGKITTSGTITEYALPSGSKPEKITAGPAGALWFTDSGTNKIGKITPEGTISEYALPSGSQPDGIAYGPDGNVWFTDYGTNKVGKLIPPGNEGNEGARDTLTIYYTAASNSTYPSCGNHPEWAGLPCEGRPAEQPGVSGLPELPVTTYAYNVFDERTATTDTVGSVTRTATTTYDGAGRPKTTELATVGSSDKAVPTVTDEYSTTTGLLAKQSATGESGTKTLVTERNSIGQTTAYTDADGNVTKYEYEPEKNRRLKKVTDGEGTGAASTQTYGYDETTGLVSSIQDSAAGTFGASYDVEGNMTAESYPNGMSAEYGFNAGGEPTSVEYVKKTHCSSSCTWYSDTVTPSIHQQWLTQTTSLAKTNYAYDGVGRLTEVQETPTGLGCTTRLYSYDGDGNRTSLTTREPGSEGKCATTGGTTQSFVYDTADRLIDPGASYESFGNVTKLASTDAGGSALTSGFYANDRLAELKQGSQELSYKLDPDGRVREAVSSSAATVDHYENQTDVPAWTSTGSAWTRNISGIDGNLAAVQSSGQSPLLQVVDLHGDVVGTSSTSETESKFTATTEATEYGVPKGTGSPKYAWLGGAGRSTELPTGVIAMGARTYVPQIGRFEQTDPSPGGASSSYAYTRGDPVNQSDASGEWTYTPENAEANVAPEGLPETFVAPGAIYPPPEDYQAESLAVLRSQSAAEASEEAYEPPVTGGRGPTARVSRVIPQEEENNGRFCSYTNRHYMEHGGWKRTGEFKSLKEFRHFCKEIAEVHGKLHEAEPASRGNTDNGER